MLPNEEIGNYKLRKLDARWDCPPPVWGITAKEGCASIDTLGGEMRGSESDQNKGFGMSRRSFNKDGIQGDEVIFFNKADKILPWIYSW